MRWPWSKRVIDPAPRAERRTTEQLLLETLNDQIAYLRSELHKAREREDELRRQNVMLVDARAAWNAQALNERVHAPAPEKVELVRESEVRSYEQEAGAFQNHLGGGDHMELEDNGERKHRATTFVPVDDVTAVDVEQAMLARERAAVEGLPIVSA